MAILVRLILIAATLLFYAAAVLRTGLIERVKLWRAKKKGVAGSAGEAAVSGIPEKQRRLSNAFALSAWIANIAVVVINFAVNGYVPFVSMYQVLTFLGFIMLPVYFYMWKVKKEGNLLVWFLFAAAIVLTGVNFMDQRTKWNFPPALQSVFFIPHVFSYMLSYSLCAVAAILTVLMLIEKNPEKKLILEKKIYDLTFTGFPFMSLGMVFGAIWANECWGNYWSWDPKETWALVTWWLYALYFHLRKIKKFRKYIPFVLIVAFLALVMTFIGVGLISGDSVHSYT